MKFAISLSAMAQQPVGADMEQRFREIVEYVRRARELGFHAVYQGQHYLTWPYQQLQVLPLLARLAAEADDMELAATVLVPLHHPVDLAERVATLDIITGGRFILIAALGYRDEEYSAFGLERGKRVSRFLECLEVMRRLWTEDEVTFHGEHFHLEGARMPLKPVRRPHPPVWIAANSDAAIQRAGRLGYVWYVNPHAAYDTIERQLRLYRESARESGMTLPQALPIGREVFVHEDRSTAFETARTYLGSKYETYAGWGQDKTLPNSESFWSPFDDLARDRFVIGTPDDCVRDLERYRPLGMAYGMFRMIWPGMPLEQGIQNLELFSQQVMPRLAT